MHGISGGVFVLAMVFGGLGAIARYWLGAYVNKRTSSSRIPLGTIVVNVFASFLDGLLVGIVANFASIWLASEAVKYVLGTGFLGGFSTFSTASVECFLQFNKDQKTRVVDGFLYGAGMLVISVCACLFGMVITGLGAF